MDDFNRTSPDRVPKHLLVEAGLELLRRAGRAVGPRVLGKGAAHIYRFANGESVRIRTTNDPVLVVVADKTDASAHLNIEGTDHVLVVMPDRPRKFGAVIGYLVPSTVAASAARTSHQDWLNSGANSNGNTTWNLWFGDDGPSGLESKAGYSGKWLEYRLPAIVNVSPSGIDQHSEPTSQANCPSGAGLAGLVARFRQEIALAAGIAEQAVRISIDL